LVYTPREYTPLMLPSVQSLIYKISLLLSLLLLLVALTWADALSPYFFAGSLFFSLSWTDALCPFFPPKTTTTTCICINRSSNHGTIMWLLYEPTITTNLLYFLIKCILGRVRSGRSEVRIICTCVSEFQFADKKMRRSAALTNYCPF